MFEGPFSLRSNQNCVLCGACIKNCPNQSPVLNLRLPGYDLWSVHTSDKAFVSLGIALVGTQLFRGIRETVWFGSISGHATPAWYVTLPLAFGAFLLAWLFSRISGQRIFGNHGLWESTRGMQLFTSSCRWSSHSRQDIICIDRWRLGGSSCQYSVANWELPQNFPEPAHRFRWSRPCGSFSCCSVQPVPLGSSTRCSRNRKLETRVRIWFSNASGLSLFLCYSISGYYCKHKRDENSYTLRHTFYN